MDENRTALLIVDVQNDFCANGALAVPDGDAVVPTINDVASRFAKAGRPVFASRDWHPLDARHFKEHGGSWPVHCVAHSHGAAFHPDLALPPTTAVVTKGAARDDDGYDAFEGRLDDGRPLAEALRAGGVSHVVVAGLATDYCVKQSALGARRAGFDVTVLEDACRAVNVDPDDERRAIEEMRAAGVRVVESRDLVTA
jgi:nicotinamidase/pyrazinamidase